MACLPNAEDKGALEQLIDLSLKLPALRGSLSDPILQFGPEPLVGVMVSAKDNNVRRQAAAYLGTLFNSGDKTVIDHVIAAYRFDTGAKDVAWNGGALFLPGIAWDQQNARELVGNLIRWHVWADIHGRSQEKVQIHNNIRSLSLAKAAGYQSPGFQEVDTAKWLQIWKNAVGADEVRRILTEQDVLEKYDI